MSDKYKCPKCKSINWEHLGEGELKCIDCKCVAGAEYFEVSFN